MKQLSSIHKIWSQKKDVLTCQIFDISIFKLIQLKNDLGL